MDTLHTPYPQRAIARLRHYAWTLLGSLLLLTTSCTEYLDIKPYGKTIPRTQEEYKALLDQVLDGMDHGNIAQSILIGNYPMTAQMEAYADNLETNLTDPAGTFIPLYVGATPNTLQSDYKKLYENIRTMNIILDGYQPTPATRVDSNLIGTAYAIRGVAFYQLLRYYCAPANQPDATLGVVLPTTFDIEARLDRSSYAETVAQIEADFQKARTYHISDKMYRFNEDVLNGYLARLYHWTGQWQLALDHAQTVVQKYPLLDSLDYRKMMETQYGLTGNRLMNGTYLSDSPMALDGTMSTYKLRPISKRWLSLFAEGKRDVRYSIAVGKNRRNKKLFTTGMRSAEMYLIAMEAQYQLGERDKALDLLNAMHLKRCPSGKPYTLSTLPTMPDDELLRVDAQNRPLDALGYAILRERRKEFYMENGDRFMELKRNGRPEWWVARDNRKYWTRRYMYTWPISVADTYVQPSLIQNPGYEDVQ